MTSSCLTCCFSNKRNFKKLLLYHVKQLYNLSITRNTRKCSFQLDRCLCIGLRVSCKSSGVPVAGSGSPLQSCKGWGTFFHQKRKLAGAHRCKWRVRPARTCRFGTRRDKRCKFFERPLFGKRSPTRACNDWRTFCRRYRKPDCNRGSKPNRTRP